MDTKRAWVDKNKSFAYGHYALDIYEPAIKDSVFHNVLFSLIITWYSFAETCIFHLNYI